ncbi:MAG: SGNH/GDSL hydrolase family protein [Chitinophagales bacterium]
MPTWKILIPFLIFISCKKDSFSPTAVLTTNPPIHVALQIPQKNTDQFGEVPNVSYFKSAIILCAGNSLTLGSYLPADENYPAQLQKNHLFDSSIVLNKGIDRISTEQMFSRISIDIQPNFKSAGRNILVAWEIGNDIFWYGTKDSAAFALFEAYCKTLHEQDWQVIAVTVPYRNNDYMTKSLLTPGGDDSIQYANKCEKVNSLLSDQWKTFSDGLADLAQDSALSGYNPKFYRPDHVHLTVDGYAVVERIIYDKIVEVNTRWKKKPI